VQVWHASEKREYGARTIRRKIHDKLPDFLEEFPAVPALPPWDGSAPAISWENLINEAATRGV
jgi:deoxyribodipyrimidine photo-lyase